jgi:hypothetical protein
VPKVTVALWRLSGDEQWHQPPGEAVTAVIEQRPLTEALVRALNSERSLHDLAGDLDRIGYPSG